MARFLNDSAARYALFSFSLAILAHVQTSESLGSHYSSYRPDHETRPAYASYRRSQVRKTAFTEVFPPRGFKAGVEKFDVESKVEPRFGVPDQVTAHGRVAVEITTGSRQQVEALLSFKAGISGGDVTAFQGWNASDSSPCGWTGVLCSQNKGDVTDLTLRNYWLQGNISDALFTLSKLQSLYTLDLSNNNFTSFISGTALLNFSRLELLNVSYNDLSGPIPNEIGHLSNLQHLSCQENSLSGQIPPSIGNCTRLTALNLRSNLLVSHIPSEIGKLTLLDGLDLGSDVPELIVGPLDIRNQILGPIPPSLGNCSSLRLLYLDSNPKLGEQIPPEFSQLQGLQALSLIGCRMTGVLPRWIGNLSSMELISFDRNQLHGPIPAELGQLQELFFLELSYNFFSGEIPSELANCTSLTVLGMATNSLGGIIPLELGACSLLQNLFLGSNSLMAPQRIPPWIVSLTQLENLDLSDMNLQGTIPDEIGSLSSIQFLGLNLNFLHGTIPVSLSNCTVLQELALYYNNLTGHIPPEVGLLASLSYFEVDYNLLTGSVPFSITNLTQLSILGISCNSLDGTIDADWGQLSQLYSFEAENNRFSGSIPWTLSNCSNLFQIVVSNNLLTGKIPATIGNFSQLIALEVGNNNLSGTIPVELASCQLLYIVDMHGNKLQGPFPAGIAGLLSLTNLQLNDNNFTGTIANSLMNLMGLVDLDLSGNKFSGSVPGESFSRMNLLNSLNLSHNFFSGSLSADWNNFVGILTIDLSHNTISGIIPDLRDLKSLQHFDVSHNNFSGTIPQLLVTLPSLQFFNASYNDLEGPVPNSSVLNPNITAASFLGNPHLCGSLLGPSQECPKDSSYSAGECKHFHCPRIWMPSTIAGMICIFGAATVAVVVWWMRGRLRDHKRIARQKDGFDTFVKFTSKPLRFAAADLQAVTKDGENVTGSGGQSVVYKASFPGCDVMAIKTFLHHQKPGTNLEALDLWKTRLMKEASIQAKLRHRNVVNVVCFCSNPEVVAMLLEYMPQGSLENHLYPWASKPGEGADLLSRQQTGGVLQQSCQLPWNVRFGIARNVAEAMTYVHHDCPEPVIHGDLKPSNILLDDDMVAKVADFGISKFVNLQGDELGKATVSKICGTIGYMPPEYAFVTTVSTKGDVFSYGVILLEMLSGLSPANVPSEVHYRKWNLERFQCSPMEMLDPILQKEGMADVIKIKQMSLLAKIAFLATRETPQSRPSMKDVGMMLLQIEVLGMEEVTAKTTYELLEADNDRFLWEGHNPNINDVKAPSF